MPEWISPAMCRSLIGALVKCQDHLNDQPDDCELASVNWVIMPLLNPDGYSFTWKNMKVFDNWRHKSSRFWRKNMQVSEDKSTQCKGIDLNRNSAVGWATDEKASPCSESYKGRSAFSAKELQVWKAQIENNRFNFVAYISFHSFGRKILYPYSSPEKILPDEPENIEELKAIADYMASQMSQRNIRQNHYETVYGRNFSYAIGGSTMDYAYAIVGVPLCYTLELQPTGDLYSGEDMFLLPESRIKSQWNELSLGLRALIEKLKNR